MLGRQLARRLPIMRRLLVAIAVALIVAGCGTAAVQPTATNPSQTASVTGGAPSTAPITAAPTPGCPTTSPITVAAYLAADPACYGSREVAIEGWEDVPIYSQ